MSSLICTNCKARPAKDLEYKVCFPCYDAFRMEAERVSNKEPKVWTVFKAARYFNGVLVEDYDGSLLSGGHPVMVEHTLFSRERCHTNDLRRTVQLLRAKRARAFLFGLAIGMLSVVAVIYLFFLVLGGGCNGCGI